MSIPDFADQELSTIANCLQHRYGQAPELQLADSELRLDLSSTQLVLCPTVVWNHEGITFVVFKTADHRYRTLFYLSPNEQFGTGVAEFDDVEKCVMTLLQVQADYERDNHKKFSVSPN